MDRKWLPLNALRAFEAAGQHLSFTAAANSLTVAQSAVSRHVIVLENFLGVALFERRPQQLVLTEAGGVAVPGASLDGTSCPSFRSPSIASIRRLAR